MRVGVVVPRFAPFHGGVETYVASAAAALARRGADVTVVTQAPRNAALPGHEQRNGFIVERHHLPIADKFDIPSLSAARAAARDGRFDVLWVHSYHTPLAWLTAEQAQAPLVFTPHYHGVGHTTLRNAMHRMYRPAGRRLMAASRRIVVDTDAEADLVLQHFSRQVRREVIAVIPPMVRDPTGGRDQRSEPPIVLTVARQEPYKRTDLLIRAIAGCRDRGVPARLVVVGDGPAMAGYRDLAAELGANDVVTFTGAVDDRTLEHWWVTASVYATGSAQEAYGIGLAEALVAGFPVVASGIPAHRELARRAGSGAAARLCSVDPTAADDASQYTEGIIELLSTTSARRERAAVCGLPGADEVGAQLLETLTAVSAGARL